MRARAGTGTGGAFLPEPRRDRNPRNPPAAQVTLENFVGENALNGRGKDQQNCAPELPLREGGRGGRHARG